MPTACLFPSAPSAPGLGVCSCWFLFSSSFSLLCRGLALALLCRFTPSYCFRPRSPGYKVGCITPLNSAHLGGTPKAGRPSHTSRLPGAWPSGEELRSLSHPAQLPWPDLGHCHALHSPTEPCGPERRLHRKPADVLLVVGAQCPPPRPPSSPVGCPRHWGGRGSLGSQGRWAP